MSTSLNQGVLVTIVSEKVLEDRLLKLLTTLGVSGYTIVSVQGAGSHGRRTADLDDFNTNIEIRTIVTPEMSDQLLEKLQDIPETYALIAFRQNVEGLFA